jgi:hypothetical protein
MVNRYGGSETLSMVSAMNLGDVYMQFCPIPATLGQKWSSLLNVKRLYARFDRIFHLTFKPFDTRAKGGMAPSSGRVMSNRFRFPQNPIAFRRSTSMTAAATC